MTPLSGPAKKRPRWREVMGWLARFTGPLLIVMASASCGFVIGVAVSAAPTTP